MPTYFQIIENSLVFIGIWVYLHFKSFSLPNPIPHNNSAGALPFNIQCIYPGRQEVGFTPVSSFCLLLAWLCWMSRLVQLRLSKRITTLQHDGLILAVWILQPFAFLFILLVTFLCCVNNTEHKLSVAAKKREKITKSALSDKWCFVIDVVRDEITGSILLIIWLLKGELRTVFLLKIQSNFLTVFFRTRLRIKALKQ